jgi:acylphosphatase
MINAMEIRKHVFYEGQVQGVGFRYTVKQIAHGFEVTGWVRNRRDGRVEVRVVGSAEEVEEFLRAIDTSGVGRFVKSREVFDRAPGDEHSIEPVQGFIISETR